MFTQVSQSQQIAWLGLPLPTAHAAMLLTCESGMSPVVEHKRFNIRNYSERDTNLEGLGGAKRK